MIGKAPLKKSNRNTHKSDKTEMTKKKSVLKAPKSKVLQENMIPDIKKLEPMTQIPIKSKSKVTNEISNKMPEEGILEVEPTLFPCKECGRSFVKESLQRHQIICKKIFINKRKEFNSAKQRFASKQQLNIFKKNEKKFEKKVKKNVVPDWKKQSMSLRLAMRQMRGAKVSEEQIKEVKKIEKSEKSNMFKCKFCQKRFNEQAGKRHQIFCGQKAKDMKNKIRLR